MAASSAADGLEPGQPSPPTGLSAAKTLTRLLAVSANRSCADCRATLVDSSQVHASVGACGDDEDDGAGSSLPPSPEAPPFDGAGGSGHRRVGDMLSPIHRPGLARVPETHHLTTRDGRGPAADPARLAARRVGGHGVFLCARCAAAHELLGDRVCTVRPAADAAAWRPAELRALARAGGNARARRVLEAYLPPGWEARRPGPGSGLGDRLLFARAKYEALAFVLPQSGPLASAAWQKILSRHPEWDDFWGDHAAQPADIDMGHGDMVQAVMQPATCRELPNRLVDFFCIVSCSDYVDPVQASADLSWVKCPEDILLVPCVTDCYPSQDAHDGLEFPEHVSTFLFPEGCQASSSALPPSFFTFVLTTASGDRLYGGALRLYDDDRDISYLKDALERSEYNGESPEWLIKRGLIADSATSDGLSDVIFLPRCLVVLSHYPFFDSWRRFLLQLYRIALVDAPLPIERFIANFVCEVPLPPSGMIQVKFGFTVNDTWIIQRPPDNELPLANFSFKPLFATLSASNVMIVFACLLKEMRIALCSSSYSILGPVAEALTSLLFPFHWEGMYLPIMPFSMLDILEAPVPYLVGLHSRYLNEVKPEERPRGVVFVDLDSDIVHLGFEESEDRPRDIPCLPERPAAKLKSKLVTYASTVYIKPLSGVSGSVTNGLGQHLEPSRRPSYVFRNSEMEIGLLRMRRQDVLLQTEKAYKEDDLQRPLSGFVMERGQLYSQESPTPHVSERKASTNVVRPLRRLRRSRSHEPFRASIQETELGGLLDLQEPEGFSTKEIREAFLRFFVALLQNYRAFLDETGFRAAEFVQSLNLVPSSADFCDDFMKTQLFQRFLEERHEIHDPEVRFFDESISAKVNRSKRNALINLGRADSKQRSFLDDTSWAIKETYTPPPPSNLGLPDDGRRYTHGKFPKLQPSLFSKVKTPQKWETGSRHSKRASVLKHQHDQAAFYQAMAPMLLSRNILRSVTKRGSKSLECALAALSSVFDNSSKSTENIGSPIAASIRDRSLHSFLKYNGHMSKIAPPIVSSQKEKPLNRISSASISYYSLKSLRNSDIMSSAEQLVLNARRKQSIIIGIFSAFQIHLKFLSRSLYENSSAHKKASLDSLMLSKTKRMEISVHDATCVIQSAYRGALIRRAYQRTRTTVLCVQARMRSRRVRWVYVMIRKLVINLQAILRRFLTRKWLVFLIDHRQSLYREHIFRLWKLDCTPLTYRSNFWFIVQFSGLLQLSIAEIEILRLWRQLGIQPSSIGTERDATTSHTGETAAHQLLAIRSHVFLQVLQLEGEEELLDVGEQSERISEASQREVAERVQIYERLSAISSNQRLMGYFQRFSVDVRVRKKQALAEILWTKYEQADDSTSTMLELFPELQYNTNIHFAEVSKKGSRKFRRYNHTPKQLERAMWAHRFLSDRTHEHVREVADVSLRFLSALSLKFVPLDERNRDLASVERRRIHIIQTSRKASYWPEYRVLLMKQFLSADIYPTAARQLRGFLSPNGR